MSNPSADDDDDDKAMLSRMPKTINIDGTCMSSKNNYGFTIIKEAHLPLDEHLKRNSIL